MNNFIYINGALHAEAVALADIANAVGTPFYCYSAAQLRKNYREFAAPFAGLNFTVHYANKANANLAVIRVLAECGAGADVTSGGELERALQAGISPDKIVYSGVGKRREEIAAALSAKIRQLNAESIPELRAINQIAGSLNVTAAVMLRVNPDVNAGVHKHLDTGHKATKFGIDKAQLPEALRLATTLPNLSFKGLTVHVGTTLGNFAPFRSAFEQLAELVRTLRSEGIAVERLDLGGGVGIPYDGQTLPPFSDYAAIVREVIAPLGCEISFEPGRRLVGDAGVLVSRVEYVKQTPAKKFLIIDAGMNDLARPAMYDARHGVVAVKAGDAGEPVTIVGPVCETGDLFGEDYLLPPLAARDLIAILQAGAYGSSMASTYNGRPLIPEVMVDGTNFAVVRKRVSVAEQMGWETVPEWIGKGHF